jgi:vitamin B12/bleomycin/antimicrobial peptide transport system ATP-binding/permease protein
MCSTSIASVSRNPPPPQFVMFISQQDYLPPGKLRGTLAYPFQPSQFASEKYIAALERTKLGNLSPDLDRVGRWERELPREDQHKFAFARLLLHRPRWILLDEAIDYLDDDTRGLVLDAFGQELAEAAIITFSVLMR